ncbi:MAG: hypothetical protein ISR65_00350 [Bacteriovoracaceae bacterium]|nr:hypothetical protein [Bacteriovoracaceae bacterium]
MKLSKLFFLAIIFIIPLIATSQEPLRYFFTKQDQVHYLISYAQEGRWYLDHYQVPNGMLQERISHRVFENRDHVLQYIHNNYPQAKLKTLGFKISEHVSTELRQQNLWSVKNSWNESWESKFSDWLQNNFHQDFFIKYNIAVDCADVTYALRWIFARVNSLPMANTLAGSEVLFTHESMKRSWRRIPSHQVWHKDKRFLKALDYLLNNTYTHSLLSDSYPLKINSDFIRSGAYYLTLTRESGHTRMVSQTHYEDQTKPPIILLSSTVPREKRTLFKGIFLISERPKKNNDGFLSMRWPLKKSGHWSLVARRAMPGFSMEQYSDSFMANESNFALAVYKNIVPDFSIKVLVQNAILELFNYIKLRVDLVKRGYNVCQNQSCAPGSMNWENWSTPSRDKKILKKFTTLEEVIGNFARIDPSIIKMWTEQKSKLKVEIEDREISLKKIQFLWIYKLISSDPRDSIAQRWALTGTAVGQNITKNIIKNFQLRKEKITKQGNTCKGNNCPLGSKQWEKWNSYTEDNELFLYYEATSAFLKYFATEENSKLNTKLNQDIIEADRKQLTTRQWLNIIPWLNADPRSTADVRWGKNRVNYNYMKIPSFENIQISKSGYALLDHKHLINLYNQQAINLTDDSKTSINFNLQNGIAVAINKVNNLNEWSFYDTNQHLLTKIEDQYQGDYVIDSLVWHSPHIFSIVSNNHWVIFNLSIDEGGVELKQIRQFDNGHPLAIYYPSSKKKLLNCALFRDDQDQTFLVQMTKQKIYKTKVNWFNDFDPQYLFYQLGDYFIGQGVWKDSAKEQTFIINKLTGKTHFIFEKDTTLLSMIGNSLQGVTQTKKGDGGRVQLANQLVTFSDDFKIQDLRDFGNFANIRNEGEFTYIYSMNELFKGWTLYRYHLDFGLEQFAGDTKTFFMGGVSDILTTIDMNDNLQRQSITDFSKSQSILLPKNIFSLLSRRSFFKSPGGGNLFGAHRFWQLWMIRDGDYAGFRAIIPSTRDTIFNSKLLPLLTLPKKIARGGNMFVGTIEAQNGAVSTIDHGALVNITENSYIWINPITK